MGRNVYMACSKDNKSNMPTIKLLPKRRNDVPTLRQREYQDIYQDKRWKKLRALKMRHNPLCERCVKKHKVTPTKEVHHIIPFDTGRNEEEIELLAFDYDNLQSLCEPCHEEAHKELKK